ncbi:hypothetical protein GCM10028857_05700 [Salinarchaeum chitinilyticum]
MAEHSSSADSDATVAARDAASGTGPDEAIVDTGGEVDAVDPANAAEATEMADAAVAALEHVIVVGYDAWTEPVLVELAECGVSFTVVTTDGEAADRLEDRGLSVVHTDDVDEACFRAAGVANADAVLVATLDDQLNVLAVLTVMNVDESMRVVTFAGERQDVQKLRAAGADSVVSIGQAVGELLVEVALSERNVSEVVGELVGDGSLRGPVPGGS